MLSGSPPFNGEDLFDQIEGGDFHFSYDTWKDITDKAKDFVSRLLVVKPQDRMTVQQVHVRRHQYPHPNSSPNANPHRNPCPHPLPVNSTLNLTLTLTLTTAHS
jgi:serine/threonine protein kinase